MEQTKESAVTRTPERRVLDAINLLGIEPNSTITLGKYKASLS